MKVELRETTFNLWMECRTQQEIAEAVGYSEKAVREFLDLLRNGENGTDAENPVSSANLTLTSEPDREFDEDELPASIGWTERYIQDVTNRTG